MLPNVHYQNGIEAGHAVGNGAGDGNAAGWLEAGAAEILRPAYAPDLGEPHRRHRLWRDSIQIAPARRPDAADGPIPRGNAPARTDRDSSQ